MLHYRSFEDNAKHRLLSRMPRFSPLHLFDATRVESTAVYALCVEVRAVQVGRFSLLLAAQWQRNRSMQRRPPADGCRLGSRTMCSAQAPRRAVCCAPAHEREARMCMRNQYANAKRHFLHTKRQWAHAKRE
eukprot:6207725-Pleurochrysis_carterae.AAC.2